MGDDSLQAQLTHLKDNQNVLMVLVGILVVAVIALALSHCRVYVRSRGNVKVPGYEVRKFDL